MPEPTRRELRAQRIKEFPWYLVRRWLYGVAGAVGGVLVYYKIIEPEALLIWLPLVLAMFNTRPPATPDETEGE